jgi:hypothetical protein
MVSLTTVATHARLTESRRPGGRFAAFESVGAESPLSRLPLARSRLAPRASGWLDPTVDPAPGQAPRCALVATSRPAAFPAPVLRSCWRVCAARCLYGRAIARLCEDPCATRVDGRADDLAQRRLLMRASGGRVFSETQHGGDCRVPSPCRGAVRRLDGPTVTSGSSEPSCRGR